MPDCIGDELPNAAGCLALPPGPAPPVPARQGCGPLSLVTAFLVVLACLGLLCGPGTVRTTRLPLRVAGTRPAPRRHVLSAAAAAITALRPSAPAWAQPPLPWPWAPEPLDLPTLRRLLGDVAALEGDLTRIAGRARALPPAGGASSLFHDAFDDLERVTNAVRARVRDACFRLPVALYPNDAKGRREAEAIGRELYDAVGELNPTNYFSDVGIYAMSRERREALLRYEFQALDRVTRLRAEYLQLLRQPYLARVGPPPGLGLQ